MRPDRTLIRPAVMAIAICLLAAATPANASGTSLDPSGRVQAGDCRGGAYDPNGKGLGVDPNGRCAGAGVTAASSPGEFPWQLGGKLVSFLFSWFGFDRA